jgi:hypothetical protein
MRTSTWIGVLALGACAAGCQSAPAGPPPPEAPVASEFSGDAAYAHLRALAQIGPRTAGTPGAEQARAYLRAELEKLGLEVHEQRIAESWQEQEGATELVNLYTVIPGASPDRFVLGAAYDTRPSEELRFVGANQGASAPALLLELARVIQANPLLYTTWIVFFDGEAPRSAAEDPTAGPSRAGSTVFARQLEQDGQAPVRLVVAFEQVGDADLHVARDLRSHRLFREEFWLAAARLGRTDAFRADDPFESPDGSHQSFLEQGLRGVVLLTDPSYGGDEPPGSYAEEDTPEHCSAESLESVGVVTLSALDRIGERLAKIDRLAEPREETEAETPVDAAESPVAPEPEPAPESAPAPESTAEPAPAPEPAVDPAPAPEEAPAP